jgi:hypothetical protein
VLVLVAAGVLALLVKPLAAQRKTLGVVVGLDFAHQLMELEGFTLVGEGVVFLLHQQLHLAVGVGVVAAV